MLLTEAMDKMSTTSALVMYRVANVSDNRVEYIKDASSQLKRMVAEVSEDGDVSVTSATFNATAEERSANDWQLGATKNIMKAVKASDGTRLTKSE